MRPHPPGAPRLSVVVPTYKRPERVERLLARLAAQSLAPREFEVILVDDGSPEPVRLDGPQPPFACELLRQENQGPGAARNLGVERCRAPLVLFLNDDAVPADDLLERHLAAHAEGRDKVAVLGTFPFTNEALREPFTRLLADSDLLFDFPPLVDGALLPWQFFWTCNISLPVAALREVGGFDALTFREAIVEDVELGYRLGRRGWKVLYRADARCEHEHALTVEAYFRRAVRLGVNLAKMYGKHGDPRLLWLPAGTEVGVEVLRALQTKVESFHGVAEKFVATTNRWSRATGMAPIAPAQQHELAGLTRKLAGVPFARGVIAELAGVDPGPVLSHGPARGRLTSIVVPSYNALAKTRNCLEALRATRDEAHPTEVLFVDNGSSDGSAEWLAAQHDIRLIRNADNAGAPRARNQALAEAQGEAVVFLDNDVVVTPGWLERMLFHAEVDPFAGVVGACADRASHGQEIPFDGPTDFAALAAFATGHAGRNPRRYRLAGLLASFCMLVRRDVIDRIGGFDERFSPWGFEDDDYTLRALLSGWHNRIALDVFVRHDTYGGAKLAAHTELLRRNWNVFAQKWGMPAGTPYGDYGAVEALRASAHPRERLFFPFRPEPALSAAFASRASA